MSAYLARLKRIENGENYHDAPDSEPSKPSKGAFEGFEGKPPGNVEKKSVSPPGAIEVLLLLSEVCRDVAGLSADQYLALLSADDIAGIECGETGLKVLKAYAPCLAEGLASGRLKVPGKQP